MAYRIFLLRHSWIIPLGLFLLVQSYDLVALLHGRPLQQAVAPYDGYQYFVQGSPAHPSWEFYSTQWNGFAFREIAEHGYPGTLPKFDDGSPAPSPWAFFPLYPIICSFFMKLGLSYGASAIIVSLASSLAAVMLLFRWLASHTKSLWIATVAVGTILLWPSAPLMQLGYAEGLALLLIVGVLALVDRQHYLLAIPLVLLLGLTRPVGVPDFIVFLVHGFFMARNYISTSDQNLGEILADGRALFHRTWRYFMLLATSAFAAILWPTIGKLITGEQAYFLSRQGYRPDELFKWFTTNPFHSSEAYGLGTWPYLLGFVGWGLLILMSPTLRQVYPLVLRVWTLVLTVYVFTVTSPVGNEFRYLLLGLFIMPFVRIPQRIWLRYGYFVLLATLALIALHGQWAWVQVHWVDAGGLRKIV